jgi:hypothetical protein
MEKISQSIIKLNEKIKLLLISYNNIIQENKVLNDKIFKLENELSNLKASLEEKKNLLNGNDQDTIFISMLIDDLLESLNKINNEQFLLMRDVDGNVNNNLHNIY